MAAFPINILGLTDAPDIPISDPFGTPQVPSGGGSTFANENLGIPSISTNSGWTNPDGSTNWGNVVNNLASLGVKAWQTDLASNIAQSQINHGQAPTFAVGQLSGVLPFNPNGFTSGLSSLFANPLTLWIIVILFFVLLFRHSGR